MILTGRRFEHVREHLLHPIFGPNRTCCCLNHARCNIRVKQDAVQDMACMARRGSSAVAVSHGIALQSVCQGLYQSFVCIFVPVVRLHFCTSRSFAFLYQWFVCFPIPVVRLLSYTSRSFAFLYQSFVCFIPVVRLLSEIFRSNRTCLSRNMPVQQDMPVMQYAGPTGHACHAICRSNRTCLSCNMLVQQDMPVMQYAVPARHACHEICRSSKTCLS